MTHQSTRPAQGALNGIVGAATVGGLWLLLSPLGGIAGHMILALGGTPGRLSVGQWFATASAPSNTFVAIDFLTMLLLALASIIIVLACTALIVIVLGTILASIGHAVLGMFRGSNA